MNLCEIVRITIGLKVNIQFTLCNCVTAGWDFCMKGEACSQSTCINISVCFYFLFMCRPRFKFITTSDFQKERSGKVYLSSGQIFLRKLVRREREVSFVLV
jgi:hypothetical protein